MAETYDGKLHHYPILGLPCSLKITVAIAPHCPLGVSTYFHHYTPVLTVRSSPSLLQHACKLAFALPTT
jgi:hypothetical protein